MYEKWIKMGPGAPWPGKNFLNNGNISSKAKKSPTKKLTPTGGIKKVTIPEFGELTLEHDVSLR